MKSCGHENMWKWTCEDEHMCRWKHVDIKHMSRWQHVISTCFHFHMFFIHTCFHFHLCSFPNVSVSTCCLRHVILLLFSSSCFVFDMFCSFAIIACKSTTKHDERQQRQNDERRRQRQRRRRNTITTTVVAAHAQQYRNNLIDMGQSAQDARHARWNVVAAAREWNWQQVTRGRSQRRGAETYCSIRKLM